MLRSGAGNEGGFLRAFTTATSKLLFDLSGGQYFATYRTAHVLMILFVLLSLVRLVRVRSALSCGVALLAMAAVVGLHPFHEAVRETALNVKLVVTVCCVAALNLSDSEPRRSKDVAVALLAFYAVFFNELGLLVWVVVVAAHAVGFPGVSRRGVLACTAVVAIYFFLRLIVWDVGGAPGLDERSSGFGFRSLEPAELVAKFGGNPLPFYMYNITASAMSILFSEPRSGVFHFTRDLVAGEVGAGAVLEVLPSIATTMVMVWFTARRGRRWARGDFDREDRLFLVFAAVLAGNAAISFPYTKDVTMGPAGVFYALGLAAALQTFATGIAGRRGTMVRAVAVSSLVAGISVGWTLRAVTLYVDLRRAAYKAQQDWVSVYEWLDAQQAGIDGQEDRGFADRVRAEMLGFEVPKPYREPAWVQGLDPRH
ncbi:MAG: hypothetical protein ACRD26_24735 [Vicinamibacterales bacterium]